MRSAAPLHVVHDGNALYDDAAERIVRAAEVANTARGRFLLVLTGGSTVPLIYERLARAPLRDRIDWTATDVFWTDERCVPPDDPDSNYGLAREVLLDRVPIPCERIHRMEGEDPNRERAAVAHEHRIRRALSLAAREAPRFDFVLLGLGADAHVASLFPGHPLLHAADRLVGAVLAGRFPVPSPNLDRLTLTPPALNGAREAVFVVTGAKKAPAVQDVLAAPRDPDRFPAQVIDPPAGTVTWLLDQAAAAGIGA
ncbi:MAG TPA: 6-phosphogluconolactonase [Gemmatimonadota bacterium]|nr:6-phosphogluconolactonase [Gemmatimonadota bacterium]